MFEKEKRINKLFICWLCTSLLLVYLAVLIGGLLGNYLNLKIFSNRTLAIITSILVIFVSIRMGIKIFL